MNVELDYLVNALSTRYKLDKYQVFNDIHKVECLVYNREQLKSLYKKNNFLSLKQKYYGLSAGILSESYKKNKQ